MRTTDVDSLSPGSTDVQYMPPIQENVNVNFSNMSTFVKIILVVMVTVMIRHMLCTKTIKQQQW